MRDIWKVQQPLNPESPPSSASQETALRLLLIFGNDGRCKNRSWGCAEIFRWWTYPQKKCPIRLAVAYRFLGTVLCQNFSVCCDDQWWTTMLVSANLEYVLATVWFLRWCFATCGITGQFRFQARRSCQRGPQKNALQRSETKATNTGIRFEDLVSAA
jgi:hypothetical protein